MKRLSGCLGLRATASYVDTEITVLTKRRVNCGETDVHSPRGTLAPPSEREDVLLWTRSGLAETAARNGLVDWLIARAGKRRPVSIGSGLSGAALCPGA